MEGLPEAFASHPHTGLIGHTLPCSLSVSPKSSWPQTGKKGLATGLATCSQFGNLLSMWQDNMLPRAAAMWFSMFNLLMAPLLPFFMFCSCQTDFNTIVDPWAQPWGYAGTVLWDNRRCTGKVGQVAPLFIAGCCKDTCAKLYQSHGCGLKSIPTTSSSQVLSPQVTIGSAPAQQGSLLGGPGGFPTCLAHLRKAWVRWGSLFSVVFPD